MTGTEIGILYYLWTGFGVCELMNIDWRKKTGEELPFPAMVMTIILWFPLLIIARMR